MFLAIKYYSTRLKLEYFLLDPALVVTANETHHNPYIGEPTWFFFCNFFLSIDYQNLLRLGNWQNPVDISRKNPKNLKSILASISVSNSTKNGLKFSTYVRFIYLCVQWPHWTLQGLLIWVQTSRFPYIGSWSAFFAVLTQYVMAAVCFQNSSSNYVFN